MLNKFIKLIEDIWNKWKVREEYSNTIEEFRNISDKILKDGMSPIN